MNVNPEGAGLNPSRLEWITDHLNRNYIEPEKISGCQVLVSRHGYPAYFKSLGSMDLERDRALEDDTIFRIYSMSKPITSIALMQLYERGYFQLNDPVSRIIPSWKDQRVWVSGVGDEMQTEEVKNPITFRNILSHTAGLTYGNTRHPVDREYRDKGVVRGEDLASFIENLSQVPLRFQPGEQWLYSYATDVCGYLVEALSGQPLDEYLEEHIFSPLGMVDSGFSVAPGKENRFAANYQRNPDKTLQLIDDPLQSTYLTKPGFLSGGGGLTGTISDYYAFCEMLRQGGVAGGERIIGSRTLALMRQNHLPGARDLSGVAIGSFSETAYEGVGFGLGFAMTLGEVETGSLGKSDYYWGGAASTIFWVDPIEDLVVIFMTQLMPSNTFNFRGQIKNIVYGAIED